MPVKKCEVCGSEFMARLSKIRTCSTQCRNRLIASEKEEKHKKIKQCEVCQKDFEVGGSNPNKRTCSEECSYILRGSLTSKSVSMKCITCGAGFLSQLSQLSITGGGSYCSKQCMYDRNKEDMTRACVCCGKMFSSPPSQHRVTTCSIECGYEWFSGSRKSSYVGATRRVKNPDGSISTLQNKWYYSIKNTERRISQNRATLSWSDPDAIRAVYEAAADLEFKTGQKYHVDHIVPLNGKTVSGLHNHFNLQILPAIENMAKGNRHWPDKP